MPVGNIHPGCIKGEDCNPGRRARPQYEEGFCWPCWASLAPEERTVAKWAGEIDRMAEAQPTEEIDAVAVAECVGLEAALLLEWNDSYRPAA